MASGAQVSGRPARSAARRVAGAAVAAVVAVTSLLVPRPATAAPDPEIAKQWGLAKVGGPTAWGTATGAGVLVAVIDSGVDLDHEELRGRIAGSTNCVGSGGDPARCTGNGQDDFGHGTHVAGIIAAARDNGAGIAGVAPGARILAVKATDAAGAASIADIDAAVRWAVDRGARVVNLSLSEANPLIVGLLGSELRPTVDYAWSKGAVPIVAGGNANFLDLALLGSYQFGDMPALIVGATGPDDGVASYSSPLGNARWTLLAPGGVPGAEIYSSIWASGRDDAYGYSMGTSMATPHVAGAVALLLELGYSPRAAVDRILGTVDRVACGGGSPTCRGRLNVAAAVGPPRGQGPVQPPAAQPTTTPGGGQQVGVPNPAPRPRTPSPKPSPSAAAPPAAPEPSPTVGTTEVVVQAQPSPTGAPPVATARRGGGFPVLPAAGAAAALLAMGATLRVLLRRRRG